MYHASAGLGHMLAQGQLLGVRHAAVMRSEQVYQISAGMGQLLAQEQLFSVHHASVLRPPGSCSAPCASMPGSSSCRLQGLP